MQRKLTAYEINHLNKFGVDPYSLDLNEIKEKPVEYITGFSEFYGRTFIVNNYTLIPRIETERIIDIALEFIKSNGTEKVNFLDLGTGSGVIGITLAKELEKRNIKYSGTLSDFSEKALSIAEENIKTHKVLLKTAQSDLFKNIQHESYDIILSNLPYVPSSRIPTLNSSVKDYEPLIALDGGEDGLSVIRKFINQMPSFLDKNGVAILEVDDTHDSKLASEFSFGFDIEVFKDINNKNRFWIVRRNIVNL